MNTIIIKLTNQKAMRLLQDMEELDLIQVLGKPKKDTVKSVTSKFRGAFSLTDEEYRDFQNYVKEVRNEWNRNI